MLFSSLWYITNSVTAELSVPFTLRGEKWSANLLLIEYETLVITGVVSESGQVKDRKDWEKLLREDGVDALFWEEAMRQVQLSALAMTSEVGLA